MFLAVISGANLLILPWRQLTTGHVTLDTVTILHCTPSLLLRLASAEARRRLTEYLEAGVRVYHMYGLTEMSVWQTMTRLESKEMVARMSTTTTKETCLPRFTTRS